MASGAGALDPGSHPDPGGAHPAGMHPRGSHPYPHWPTTGRPDHLAFAPERIEHWPLARLQPSGKNAKVHGSEQMAKIAASMPAFGWTVPCLEAKDGELIAGHGRVPAATQLGLTEAPVIMLGHLNKAQRRACRITVSGRGSNEPIASNRTTEGPAQFRRGEIVITPTD